MVVTNKTKQIKTKNNNFTHEPNCIYYYLYSTFSTLAKKIFFFFYTDLSPFLLVFCETHRLFNFNPKSNTGYVN